MSFPDADAVARAQDAYDAADFDWRDHHPDCPLGKWTHPWLYADCECAELRKEDREAAADERAEDERKYGGL